MSVFFLFFLWWFNVSVRNVLEAWLRCGTDLFRRSFMLVGLPIEVIRSICFVRRKWREYLLTPLLLRRIAVLEKREAENGDKKYRVEKSAVRMCECEQAG